MAELKLSKVSPRAAGYSAVWTVNIAPGLYLLQEKGSGWIWFLEKELETVNHRLPWREEHRPYSEKIAEAVACNLRSQVFPTRREALEAVRVSLEMLARNS